MANRNPADVLSAISEAFKTEGDARTKIMAVRAAMLTAGELAAADTAPQDERDDSHFDGLVEVTQSLLDSARYTAPELFFCRQHAQLGQAILRQEEIAAINLAHADGRI